MNKIELKEYLLETCDYLEVLYNEIEPDIFRLSFPPLIMNSFGEKTIDITFEKDKRNRAVYVSIESFVIQKLALFATNKESGMSFSSLFLPIEPVLEKVSLSLDTNHKVKVKKKSQEKNQFLVIWCKISLKGHMVEEKIKGYKFNLLTEEVTSLSKDTDTFFEKLEERKEKRVPKDKRTISIEKVLFQAKKEAFEFSKEKTKEASTLLAKEIQRIHDYYDILHDEDAFSETYSTEDGTRKESLKKEREYLIDQQKNKYSFSEDDTVINIIETMFLEEKKECAEVLISSPSFSKTIYINGDLDSVFTCSLTGKTDGVFVLTSDGDFVLKEKTYTCSKCEKCFDLTKTKKCAVCSDIVCNTCAVKSDLSQAALCEKHSKSCTNCSKRVGLNETIECKGCGDTFCSWCAAGDMCDLCSGIF